MNIATVALGLSCFQAAMVARNLTLFRPPAPLKEDEVFDQGLSVLVPARNEEENLENLLLSLQRQESCRFEVVVLDDNSEDRTWEVVSRFAQTDPRFHIRRAPELPEGWAGKQHACHCLSTHAKFDYWLFVDADVVMTDPFALARIGVHVKDTEAGMSSSIPRQVTKTWAEQMVIPLIHLVLLSYLPFWEMRRNRMPALGAACGQMVAVKREAYLASGGHKAVRHRLHDATALASNMRKQGILTDLFDSTPLADCRMYRNARDVFLGFAKNATEGMAQPLTLPLWTVLLLGANVLPWILGWLCGPSWMLALAQIANLGVFAALAKRYQQKTLGTLFRPAGVLMFVTIQWVALVGKWVGWKASWKGRVYDRIYS